MEIPENWIPTIFRDIGMFFGGGTPSTINVEYWNGPIQWTTSKRLGDSLYLDLGERTISDRALKESSTTLIPAGNLLIGTRVGIGKIVVNRIDIAISQDLTGVIVDKSKYLPEFVAYQTREQRLQEYFQKQKRGVTIQGISRDDLKEFILYVPPLPEQNKMVSILLKIHKAIEIQGSIIEKTRELKKSTLHHVFTRGLRGKKLRETEIGPIPESWEACELDSVLKLAQYGLSVRGLSNGQYPILRMNCQIDGQVHLNDLQYVNLDNDIFEKFKIVNGDILFNRTNSWELVGRTAIYHSKEAAVFASYLIRLKLDEEKINPDYLNYFFNMDQTQNRLKSLASRGVSQSNISASKLKTFQVPVPALDEQREIIKLLHVIDQKVNLYTAKKSALQDLFKTMLNKLMTGELRVKDLDIDISEVSQ